MPDVEGQAKPVAGVVPADRGGKRAYGPGELPPRVMARIAAARMASEHRPLDALLEPEAVSPPPSMTERIAVALESVQSLYGDTGLAAVAAFLRMDLAIVDPLPDTAPSFAGLGPDIIQGCEQVADLAWGLRQPVEGVPQPGFDIEASGNQDCLSKARPGEPMFVLLGRDPVMEATIRFWADAREQAMRRPYGDPDALPDTPREWGHIDGARRFADAARAYRVRPVDGLADGSVPGDAAATPAGTSDAGFSFDRSGPNVIAVRGGVFWGMGDTEEEALAAARRRLAAEGKRHPDEVDWASPGDMEAR